MSMTDKKCDECGGPMLEGIPGDIYCPKDECFQKGFDKAMSMVRDMKERKEREDYERLHEKFKTDRMDRG